MNAIYTRSKYNAPAVGQGMARQGPPREAFIHHSDDHNGKRWNTKKEQVQKVHAINDYHTNVNGWSMGGYHWVVFQWTGDRNEARAFQLRPALYVPAAQEGHNTGTLAICVVGNGMKEELLPHTRACIRRVIDQYSRIDGIGGHRDVVATACPGDKFYKWVDDMALRAHLRTVR